MGELRDDEFETQSILERMTCVECGILFAAPKEFLNTRRQNPNLKFHCPNGHSLNWPGAKTHAVLVKEVEALTEQIKKLKQENVGLRSQVDQLDAKHEAT